MQLNFRVEAEQDLDPIFERLFKLLKDEPTNSVQEEAARLLAVVSDYVHDVGRTDSSA